MPLQGNLTDLPLIDLVQVLTLQNKTGVLSISRDFSQGQVCFSRSKLYSAFVHHTNTHKHLEGVEALYDLLQWPDGQFNFELTSSLPAVQNVNVNWDYIILEHCRRQDELEQQQAFRKRASLRPRLSPNPSAQAEVTLSLEDWQVLLQVNGQVTFEDIARVTRLALDQVLKIGQKLEKQGLIDADSTTPAPAPGRLGHVSPWQPGAVPSQSQYYSRERQVSESPPSNPRDRIATARLTSSPPRHYLPPEPVGREYPAPIMAPIMATPVGDSTNRPKVQRGLLSSIMSKIRGL